MLSDSHATTSAKRIFIDGSYTLGSGRCSGIERVVRNLIAQCSQMASEGELPHCQQVISHTGSFMPVDEKQLNRLKRSGAIHTNVLATLPKSYQVIANAACSAVPSRRIRKWLLPQPGHLGMFKLFHSAHSAWVHKSVAKAAKPIQAMPGDLFVLPDAYWVNRLRSTVWPAAEQARAAGAKVATVIYDLIPLTHPHFVGQERSDAFRKYLFQCAQNSDLLLAISDTVRLQLQEFLEENKSSENEFCNEVRSFELGCEFSDREGAVRDHVANVFSGRNTPYLTVSTFDPRKNHGYLLDAFDAMWEAGKTQRLCLVGRLGSRCDDTVKRIQEHPLLGKKLFLFNDLSDAELQYCYRRARGVVFPSIVEGFGLPIVEALWFKRKTFASDTEIHREVGKDDCSYFNLNSIQHLVKKIEAWESKISQGEHSLPIERELTSWRDSALQVIESCQALFASGSEVDRRRAA